MELRLALQNKHICLAEHCLRANDTLKNTLVYAPQVMNIAVHKIKI